MGFILVYRVSILDIKTGSVVSRVFNWKSFRAVTLQEGLLALRESTLDNLLMFDLADFLDRSREVESLACRWFEKTIQSWCYGVPLALVDRRHKEYTSHISGKSVLVGRSWVWTLEQHGLWVEAES